MTEQPHEGVHNMSDKRLRELHLYKELITNEEASERYQLLRLSGATPDQARRWRHWSPNHYEMMLRYLCNPVPLAERLENIRLSVSEEGLKSIAVATAIR